MKLKKTITKLFGVLMFLAVVLPVNEARADVEGPYSIGFNLNIPTPAGESTGLLKNGFGFGMDFGYRPEESPLGIRLDVSHGNFDLTSAVLNQINRADSGWASYWGFDLSAVLTAPGDRKVRPYIQAGPGIYYQHAEASRFTGGGTVVCDPWYGCWEYNDSEDIADWSTWRLGWMGGAGLNIEFDGGGALFLQAQYHLIENTNFNLEIVPIGMGYRHSF